MPPTTNPIDLTTLAAVKLWLTMGSGTTDDQSIQDCITAASAYWIWDLGVGPQNGVTPTQSPLKTVITGITETYDGSGSNRMFLRIRPIVAVSALSVNGIAVPASSGVNVPGFVIDGTGKSISIRSGFGAPGGGMLTVGFSYFNIRYRGWAFAEGIQNVQVTYSAGFAVTPYDIELAVRQMVAVNYKRRQWIDQKAQAMASGAGTVSYRDWELPPEVRSVMDHYRRRALA